MMRLWWVRLAVAALWIIPLEACAQRTGGLPPAAPTQQAVRPALDRLLPSGDIQVAEEHLRVFGYEPGPVDGIFTAQTQAAVRAFQDRYGLPVSGLLDQPTRRELLPGLDPKRTQ
jgi:peptidoglycan hydrolase-like protein with peptidoglycan-binding domain